MSSNPGSYALSEVPPVPGAGSRFFIPRTTGGWSADPAEQLGDAAHSLALVRKGGQPSLTPAAITVPLFFPAKRDGEWVSQSRDFASGCPMLQSTRPGKLGQVGDLQAGPLLDSFLLGGEAWEKATDSQVWEALRGTCAAHDLSGAGLRSLADWVAVAICARAGLSLTPYELPHPYKTEKPKGGGASKVSVTVDGETVQIVSRRGGVLVGDDGRQWKKATARGAGHRVELVT